MKKLSLINPEDVSLLPVSALLKIYNFCHPKPTKRFADRASAIRRTNAILDEYNRDQKLVSDLEEFIVKEDLEKYFAEELQSEEFQLVAPVEKIKAADRPVDLTCYNALRNDKYRKELEETNDCVVIAVSLITGLSYKEVHSMLAKHGRKPKRGTNSLIWSEALKELGYEVEEYTFHSASKYPGCHGILLKSITSFHPKRFPEYFNESMPNLLCITSDHAFAMIAGQTKDWSHEKYLRIKHAYKVTKIS